MNLDFTTYQPPLIFIKLYFLGPQEPQFKIPEPLPKHNMTLEELRKYDGKGSDGRICIAILGKVYDCSKGSFDKFC